LIVLQDEAVPNRLFHPVWSVPDKASSRAEHFFRRAKTANQMGLCADWGKLGRVADCALRAQLSK